MGSGTGSSRSPERAALLHRLRSTLARAKAELELAEIDDAAPPVRSLLGDLDEALALLSAVEDLDNRAVRVLVVDDDVRLAEITARGLRRLGFEAESSASLRKSRAGEILVIDLGLVPGLQEDALDELRSARPIVVTGATDKTSRALASAVNATDYLVKPVELDELAAAIKRRTDAVTTKS